MKSESLTKSQLKRIGEKIRKSNNLEELRDDLEKIQDWRGLHSVPLNTLQTTVRKQLKRHKYQALCVQRLKRMPSIVDKLKRFPMDLSKMQDIGGMRIVAQDVAEVRNIFEVLVNSISDGSFERIQRFNDYISCPKDDGYRGIHQAFRYISEQRQDLKGMLIELQIRTKLQHLWATAVETYSIIKRTSLKTGQGAPLDREFFAVASALFALEENAPVPKDYLSYSKEQLVEKFLDLDSKTQILKTLKGITILDDGELMGKDSMLKDCDIILRQDLKNDKIEIFGVIADGANKVYETFEREAAQSEGVQVLLIKISSFKSIKSAYPNFFLDTKDFCKKLDKICHKSTIAVIAKREN